MSVTVTRLRALVVRMEPTRRQEELCAKTEGCARFVYNWGRALREDLWLAAKSAGATGFAEPFRYSRLCSLLPALKTERPWLAEVPSHTLQQALRDLDRAYGNFFAGRTRYPQFRRKGCGAGFRFPDPLQFEINGRAIFLPKLGWVKYRRSIERMPGRVKSITVKRAGDRWQASLLYEEACAAPAANIGPAIGLDAGVTNSAAISDGDTFHLPVASPLELRRAATLARAVSRKKLGSANRRRAQRRRNRFQGHILRRVSDARHKFTTRLAQNHGLIAVEDLRLKSMTASAKGTMKEPGKNVRAKAGLNRAILAQGIGETLRQLDYKCQWSGARLVRVEPRHTSQTCSTCGYVHPDNRVTRDRFSCQKCGHDGCADVNAAKAILQRALSTPSEGRSAAVCRGSPSDPTTQKPARQNRPATGRLTRGIPVKAAHAA